VVVATNSPVNDWVILHTKQSAYRTFVIARCTGTRPIRITTYDFRKSIRASIRRSSRTSS
jgi:hypothetical protein